MHRHNPFAAVLVTSLAIALSACGSSDSDAGDSGTPDAASTSEPGPSQDAADDTSAAAPNSEAEAPEAGNGEGTDQVSGSGLVRVDGVEYPDFVGDCFISRGIDPDTYEPVEVGDLSTPGLSVVVGIDNVASAPAVEANFVMTGEANFRMVGLGGPGTIDSIAYVDPPTSVDSVDLALVAFSGTTDDGIPVVAEVVCEIGLG